MKRLRIVPGRERDDLTFRYLPGADFNCLSNCEILESQGVTDRCEVRCYSEMIFWSGSVAYRASTDAARW